MEQNNIFNRLYEQEATPPPGMWNRIAQKLDEEEAALAPVVAMPTKVSSSNWLKIAVAACLVGFITMTTLWIMERNSNKNDTIATTDVPQLPKPKDTIQNNNGIANTTPNNIATTTPITTTNNSIATTITTPAANPTIAQNNTRPNNTKANPTIPQPYTPTTTPIVQVVPDNPVVINNPPISIKDTNGQPIRSIDVVRSTDPSTTAGPISQGDKAIGNIITKISLSSDKEEIDSIINTSVYWKQQIKEWRSKLIKSGYTPSFVNHLDILELKKLIDEKK